MLGIFLDYCSLLHSFLSLTLHSLHHPSLAFTFPLPSLSPSFSYFPSNSPHSLLSPYTLARHFFFFLLTLLTLCCLSFTHFFSPSCMHLYAYLTLSCYSYPSFSCISPFSTSPFTLSWFFLALLTLLHPCPLSPISSRQIFFAKRKAKTKFKQCNWLAKKFTAKKLDHFLLFGGLCK